MPEARLHEVVIPTDRWHVRAVSPVDIRNGVNPTQGHPVIVHPGWGKAPERHRQLLEDLADGGFVPIGVDTRYGYADQQLEDSGKGLLRQPYRTGDTNPYFEVEGQSQNRWEYRRPTALLHLCEQLGVRERSYVGHSEGGRIVALAALATAAQTEQILIVNGAGTGDSTHGYKGLLHSNVNQVRKFATSLGELREAAPSALGSIWYAAMHLRRTFKEKQVIQDTDLWPTVDELHERGVYISVFHATGDEIISFDDAQREANTRPWLDFRPTNGTHSNVYDQEVRDEVLEALAD